MKVMLNGQEVAFGGGVTMEDVNTAIEEAITDAIQEAYDGTDGETETSV